jgi:hypothetical protein
MLRKPSEKSCTLLGTPEFTRFTGTKGQKSDAAHPNGRVESESKVLLSLLALLAQKHEF